jgi:predicted lysophospholipase L1 biosynthesis ABC-type transport system permease subunit
MQIFESKTWYKEVIILGVIPTVIAFVSTFVAALIVESLHLGYLPDEDRLFSIITGFTALVVFIGLAVWWIYKNKLTIKE